MPQGYNAGTPHLVLMTNTSHQAFFYIFLVGLNDDNVCPCHIRYMGRIRTTLVVVFSSKVRRFDFTKYI